MWASPSGAKAKFACGFVFASISRRMWLMWASLVCHSEVCIRNRICQYVAAIAHDTSGGPIGCTRRNASQTLPDARGGAAPAAVPLRLPCTSHRSCPVPLPSGSPVLKLGNACLVGNGDPCLRLFVRAACWRTSGDLQVLLPCSIAHCGIAVFTFADFDPHADNLRVPPVRATLIDCIRACWCVGSLLGGASSDIRVLLSCPIARCWVAVLAFTDFDVHANNLRIPPAGTALIDCVRAYLYA